MDLVNQFQEITGISDQDLAKEILEQCGWNIESAANLFLSDPSAIESPKSSSKPPPVVPPRRSKRLLNFEITFYLDDGGHTSVVATLPNIPESYTIGDLKQCFIDYYSTELMECATRNGIDTDNRSILFSLRFDELQNQGRLNNDVTLKSLHLPLNNCWTARLSNKPRRRFLEANSHETPSSSSSSTINLQIRLSGHPLLNTPATANGISNGPLHLNLDATTSLTELKRRVERETQIPIVNQRWSLPAGSTSRPRLDELIRDLNSPSTSSSHTLQHYSLRSGRTYNFSLKQSQTPSPQDSSVVGQTSTPGNTYPPPRPARPRKRGSYDFDQSSRYPLREMDEDVDGTNFCDIDDPNDGLTFASEVTNPCSLPLIPANLVDSPQLAVENFYRVFLQRYCSGPSDPTPPFIVCPFDEALGKCFKTLRVADRKPMFIYLHNDHSVAAHIFCNQLLCSRELCQFLEATDLKVWPWDVTLEAAKSCVLRWLEPRFEYLYAEISRMQTDQFPLFIMICKLEGSYEVISLLTGHGFTTTPSTLSWSSSVHTNEATQSMDTFPSLEAALTSSAEPSRPKPRGNLNADDVVGELWQKFVMYQERLQPEILAEEQRAEREFMRMEQDRAYEESLEQDRLKSEAKQREEAEAERREREMREQEEAAQREARDRQVASTRALPPEPPVGTPGIATIRFRLPTVMPLPPSYEHLPKTEQQPISNGMLTRRFRGEDTLLDLKNFMESLGYSVNDFKLLTTYPRVDLTAETADNVTVAELKLVPQETLNLEQR